MLSTLRFVGALGAGLFAAALATGMTVGTVSAADPTTAAAQAALADIAEKLGFAPQAGQELLAARR